MTWRAALANPPLTPPFQGGELVPHTLPERKAECRAAGDLVAAAHGADDRGIAVAGQPVVFGIGVDAPAPGELEGRGGGGAIGVDRAAVRRMDGQASASGNGGS